MSNDQWNNGQGEPQRQPSSGEWNQGENTSSAQNWDQTSPHAAQSQDQQPGGAWTASQGQGPQQQQPSATEWNTGAQQQPSANEWTTGAQQQHSASERQGDGPQWNPQSQQDWNQAAQGPQGWNQNPQGGSAPGQQWQQRPPREPTGLGNLFDLSFKRFVLPSGGGAIFMLAAIGFLVHWLFTLIWTFSAYGMDFAVILDDLVGGLVLTFVYILLTRAFLEGMSALVSMSTGNKDTNRS